MWTNGADAPEGRRSRETLRKGGREDVIQIEPAAYGGVHVITLVLKAAATAVRWG